MTEQITENITLKIDTEALQEKQYEASAAYTDEYEEIDILTKESLLLRDAVLKKKSENRSQLMREILTTPKEERSPHEHVLQCMEKTPIFTSRIKYGSLSGQNQNPSPTLSVWILFLIFMGLIGFLLALYSQKRKAEKKDVH